MRIFSFLTLLLTVLFSELNLNAKYSEIHSLKKDSIVVLIIHNPPKISDTLELGKHMHFIADGPFLKIWDNIYCKELYKNQKNDTVLLKPIGNNLLLQHWYNYVNFTNIFIRLGDTLDVTYEMNIPRFTLRNRITKKYDLQLNNLFDSLLYQNQKYTALQKYEHPILNFSDLKTYLNTNNEQQKNDFALQALNDFEMENLIIDSIKLKDLISNEVYKINIDRIKFTTFCIQLEEGIIDKKESERILDSVKALEYGNSIFYLLKYSESYAIKYIEKNAPVIKSKNGSISDYRNVFSKIQGSYLFSPSIKKLLLYKYLKAIANNFSTDNFLKYNNKFKTDFNDSILNTDISERFIAANEVLHRNTNSVSLINKSKGKIGLKEIIDQNKGKIIYVDFWASWCLPCRYEIPYSKKIMEKYKYENIVFLYLSIDKDLTKWQKADNIENLNDNSFVILDQEKSSFLKEIRLNTIPRYLLYDKNGNLVNPNAPNPSSPALGVAFEKLLKNK